MTFNCLNTTIFGKVELLPIISHDLQQTYDFSKATAQFWGNQSIETIAAAQSAPVFINRHDLVADFWPKDESADDINDFIAAQRGH